MRVTLITPVATGAMAQIVNELTPALSSLAEVSVLAPRHFVPSSSIKHQVYFLDSPMGRRERAIYWYNPLTLKSSVQTLLRTSPDVVHLLNGTGYLHSILLPKILHSIPLFVSMHDPKPHRGNLVEWVTATLAHQFLLKKATRIHALSQFSADVLRVQGYEADKLVTTRHGALITTFTQHNVPDIKRTNSMLFFGRWEHYKGIDLLIKALVLLKRRGIPQHCILAGAGQTTEEARLLLTQNPDIFEVHNDYLSDVEVAHLFQRANRTVLPYRDATQSSLPALAQAYGHGIIATRVGSFPEEVTALNGILVEPNDINALADGIVLSKNMHIFSRSAQIIDYSWSTVASILHRAYLAAIEEIGSALI